MEETKLDYQTHSNGSYIFKGENSGDYEWHIKDKSLINKMMNAKNG